MNAAPRRRVALAALCATLGGCASSGAPMAGCLPGAPSPTPQLQLAAAPDSARVDAAGTITVLVRQLVDGRPVLDHAVIVFVGADSAPDRRVVDRTGEVSARRPGGAHHVQIRAVGFEAVETSLLMRAGYQDTLRATLRLSPTCMQGEFLRVRLTAHGKRMTNTLVDG